MEADGVTVAIPNWNHELLLPRSISSALQTVRVLRAEGMPAEVLVVDDCSRDGSPALLRQLEAQHYDDGLRVLARRENAGLAAARNLALEQARHQYVAFLDADNELLPATMPLFCRAIATTGAAAVYGNLLVRRLAARTASGVLSNESFQQRMFRENYVDAFALVDRLQLLDCGGYSDHLPTHEDYELWLHLACCGRSLIFVPVVFGYYYRMPNSMLAESNRTLVYSRAKRAFDQFGCRKHLPPRTLHLRYHPAIGYL
jgi:glycosyltransferase involved in cell wall biosynthesis